MVKIAVVGHLTIDEIEVGGKRYTSMGGVACYASLAARALGAEVEIFSKVGKDFPKEYLQVLERSRIGLSGLTIDESGHSTRFQLIYRGDHRRLKILARASSINLEEILDDLRGFDAVYLGPVAWELDLSSIKKLSSQIPNPALDPQGLMRSAGGEGAIAVRRINLEIPGLWMLRISGEEAQVLTGFSEPALMMSQLLREVKAEITALTLGRLGGLIAHGSRVFKVPCYEALAVDPTGAGDVFGGALMASYLESHDLKWSIAMGSAMASIVVEGSAYTPLLSRDLLGEARRRAEQIHELIESI